MQERQRSAGQELTVVDDPPLIGVVAREDGRDVVRYFDGEDAADTSLDRDAIAEALSAIGSWSELDWDEMERALDRRTSAP